MGEFDTKSTNFDQGVLGGLGPISKCLPSEMLLAYVAGKQPEEERALIHSHLLTCGSCTAAIYLMRKGKKPNFGVRRLVLAAAAGVAGLVIWNRQAALTTEPQVAEEVTVIELSSTRDATRLISTARGGQFNSLIAALPRDLNETYEATISGQVVAMSFLNQTGSFVVVYRPGRLEKGQKLLIVKAVKSGATHEFAFEVRP